MSYQQTPSVSPGFETKKKARKFVKGVCILNMLASLQCEFDTEPTTIFPEAAGKSVSLQEFLDGDISHPDTRYHKHKHNKGHQHRLPTHNEDHKEQCSW